MTALHFARPRGAKTTFVSLAIVLSLAAPVPMSPLGCAPSSVRKG